MNAAGRLGVYGAGLAVAFAGAFAAAGALVPEGTVSAWMQSADGPTGQHASGQHSGGPEESPAPASSTGSPVRGVAMEQGGYLLQGVSAPEAVGQAGELSFTITGPDQKPVTAFETEHEKDLHLIVVRSDGAHYRHVHPVMDQAGRWSLPWSWDAAGTYRIYTDAVPSGTGGNLTLTRTLDVAGDFEPAASEAAATDEVGGLQVSLNGGLSAGSASTLTVNVSRNGQPVTDLQPYLGAYGHLVALRSGDLAYLHVHPEGAEPAGNELSGPAVEFATTAPTPGRYYLYFDFQVDGTVHTAGFALDTRGSSATGTGDSAADDGHSDH